jgi:hypothetical protein
MQTLIYWKNVLKFSHILKFEILECDNEHPFILLFTTYYIPQFILLAVF